MFAFPSSHLRSLRYQSFHAEVIELAWSSERLDQRIGSHHYSLCCIAADMYSDRPSLSRLLARWIVLTPTVEMGTVKCLEPEDPVLCSFLFPIVFLLPTLLVDLGKGKS